MPSAVVNGTTLCGRRDGEPEAWVGRPEASARSPASIGSEAGKVSSTASSRPCDAAASRSST